jgi:hypothetical protein
MEHGPSHIHYIWTCTSAACHIYPCCFCFPTRTSAVSSCQSEDNQW